MTVSTRTANLDPGVHGVRCAWGLAMAIHHAVGISRQRNSGYRLSRVNIVAQGLSTPDPSLSPTHLSIRTGHATVTHYTHHQVSLMVSRNTTLALPWGCAWASLWGRPQHWHAKGACVTPKEERRRKKEPHIYNLQTFWNRTRVHYLLTNTLIL